MGSKTGVLLYKMSALHIFRVVRDVQADTAVLAVSVEVYGLVMRFL